MGLHPDLSGAALHVRDALEMLGSGSDGSSRQAGTARSPAARVLPGEPALPTVGSGASGAVTLWPPRVSVVNLGDAGTSPSVSSIFAVGLNVKITIEKGLTE